LLIEELHCYLSLGCVLLKRRIRGRGRERDRKD